MKCCVFNKTLLNFERRARNIFYYCFKICFLTVSLRYSNITLDVLLELKLDTFKKNHDICFMKWTAWKADIVKMSIAVHYFCKTLHHRCFTAFWIWMDSEYTRILNMPLVLSMSRVLNMPGFWTCLGFSICQGSEYASGSEYVRFSTYQGLEYARVLDMSGFWICRWFWIGF